jgi:hypothetical protein
MTVIVTQMQRKPDGKLVARVSRGDGKVVPVVYECGAWQTDEKPPRFVLTDVAIELQARARAYEKKEADMPDENVVPWGELTPQAREVVRAEFDRLLGEAPNQGVVPIVREAAERQPETIPYAVAQMREELETSK